MAGDCLGMAVWTCRGLEVCPGCWAELAHCLAAALPHVLLEPDDSGSSSLHMCFYIYIHTYIYKAPSGAQSPLRGDQVLP